MKRSSPNILLVEPCSEALELLVRALSRTVGGRITCVAEADAAVEVDLERPQDLVIVEAELPDNDGVSLADELLSISRRPIILMGASFGAASAIDAFRAGVSDVFVKPFRVGELTDSARRLLEAHFVARAHAERFRSMRRLVRRVLRERKDLGKRVELVCRDLVGAQRKLVHRVAALDLPASA